MCGIAILISSPQALLRPELIQEMLSLVAHRGPDDEGYAGLTPDMQLDAWGGADTPPSVLQYPFPIPVRATPPNLQFQILAGSRRLSIVDVNVRAHQPMTSSDGRYILVFNGEIYNYPSLQIELRQLGVRLETASDSEILLQSYLLWGPACLDRFNGDFAFVIIDSLSRTYFAARDRYGVKPLYAYRQQSGLLAFASEIKQFLCLPDWRARVNPQAVYEFLRWGKCDHSTETLFEHVIQLPAGHYWSGSWHERWGPSRLWYKPCPEPFSGSLAESAHQLRELFLDAVQLRIPAEVDYGASLSGGLDSSAICYALSKARKSEPVQSFSVRSYSNQFDEGHYIDLAVSQGGFVNHQVWPEPEAALNELSELVWHQDEPIAGSSVYAEWLVFKRIGQAGLKVCLDGHGSDEYLGGYASFLAPYCAALLAKGAGPRKWFDCIRLLRFSGLQPQQVLTLLFRQILPLSALDFLRHRFGKAPGEAYDWIDLNLLKANPGLSAYLGERDPDVATHRWACLFKGGIAPQLHWADRSSMAFSVESRVPFLDHRLVEFGLSLPEEHLFAGGQSKAVLRRALQGVVPTSLLARRSKLGYATAEEHWVRRDSREPLRQRAYLAIERCQGILNDGAKRLVERVFDLNQPYNPHLLWPILSLGEWMDRFRVQVP